jgi:hypothetical protein
MRKDYTPTSPLHPTYVGPMRIIELYDIGALLKDPRTGDIMSVHYQNIRKTIHSTSFIDFRLRNIKNTSTI